jgi:hypothetical protein
LSRLGGVTAFAAEAALWVAGAALIAGAAGAHWSVSLPAIDIIPAKSTQQPATLAPSTPPVTRLKAFLAKPTLQFTARLEQTSTISGPNILIQETTTGTVAFRAGDASSSMTNKILGVSKTEDEVSLGKYTYSRENGGKWSKRARVPADTAGSSEMLSATQPMNDAGLETKNGEKLHRIEAVDTSAYSAALQAGSTRSKYDLTLVFWVADDGTPVAIEVAGTYQDVVGEATATVTVDQQWIITATSGVNITAPI